MAGKITQSWQMHFKESGVRRVVSDESVMRLAKPSKQPRVMLNPSGVVRFDIWALLGWRQSFLAGEKDEETG